MAANILIVEDEPAIQELLALNLTQAGHNSIRALSVEQAQLLMRDALPDLIILDLALCEVAIAGLGEVFKPEKVVGDFCPEFLRIRD